MDPDPDQTFIWIWARPNFERIRIQTKLDVDPDPDQTLKWIQTEFWSGSSPTFITNFVFVLELEQSKQTNDN